MNREPEGSEAILVGDVAVVVDHWVDPEEELHDDVYGEPAPAGCQGWRLAVCASTELDGQRFEGYASLGHVWIQPDTAGYTYLEEELANLRVEATLALLEEIKAIAGGRDVVKATERWKVAVQLRLRTW